MALAVIWVSVGVGVVLGLWQRIAARTTGPIRTFAVVAAGLVVALSLLPHAIASEGLAGLCVALLGIALRNLIGNAWKFSGRKPVVAIEVAEDPAGPEGTTTLRIADRGAGFDPERSDKLFMPFYRLHHAADFPGTGIGLATVQRIVQRHGGTIRADAVPETGATFWLSLPRAGAEGIDSMRGDER